MMLVVVALTLVAALAYLARTPREHTATHTPSPKAPSPPPVPAGDVTGKHWQVAVPMLRESQPTRPVAVMRKAPLKNSLEMPAMKHVTYVFVDGEGTVRHIVRDSEALLEHDGFVETFPPL
jgi:hypothetical protein